MQAAELLEIPELGLIPVVSGVSPSRPVRSVYTTDLPDPMAYLSGGELVLTSTTWYRQPGDAEVFVAALAAAGCAGLVAGTARIHVLPDALAEACERKGLPLFTIADDVSFGAVAQLVHAAIGDHTAQGRGVTARRALLTSFAAGEGLMGLLANLERATGVSTAALSATGRHIIGEIPGIPAEELASLHRKALAGWMFPSVQKSAQGRGITFHAVAAPAPRRAPSAYIAVDDDHGVADPVVADMVADMCALLSIDRAANDETRTLRQRLLSEVIDLMYARNRRRAKSTGQHRLGAGRPIPRGPGQQHEYGVCVDHCDGSTGRCCATMESVLCSDRDGRRVPDARSRDSGRSRGRTRRLPGGGRRSYTPTAGPGLGVDRHQRSRTRPVEPAPRHRRCAPHASHRHRALRESAQCDQQRPLTAPDTPFLRSQGHANPVP
ncbi:hypothetical protein GPX89_15220 [Nocardia sp. ET3-3]|uniref:Purine catabolism PurC-like domain-containing protein n=1 Tax=Nocardia terrae TaxID=2675851 RepID=A0A7K1UW29_9NOCA|nr:hypothetical protein [Nocardia terrae]